MNALVRTLEARLGGPQLAAKILVATTLLALAVLRLAFGALEERMDRTFLVLVGLAILVLILPWERLTSVKAGGVELTLELPQVAGALRSLGLDRVEDERLRLELARLEPEIGQVRGSRVLWIDDFPTRVVGLRRLLRAFGVETVVATSTAEADATLGSDNDFDMIVSDVQRTAEADQVTLDWLREHEPGATGDGADGFETPDGRRFARLHEGVNFVVRLRLDPDRDATVKALPVLFYAAYDWPRLVRFTSNATATSPDTEISNSPMTFVPRAIRMLARARATKIPLQERKEPT